MPHPEVGEELTVRQLRVNTVVAVTREDRPYAITVWVKAIGPDGVWFWLGETGWHLLVMIREDGQLVDDTGKVIHVYEYLGEI